MIEHLTVSTVVLLLAMLAARTLPMTARTRHAILLCGLAKFAIPSAVFSSIGVQTLNVVPTPALMRALPAPATTAATQTNWLLIGWVTVATLLFARWLLLRTRTVAAALRSPAPASPRELDALAAARQILGMRTAVDLVRSPLCEAPAVVRVIRPVILLPARGCDDLTDDELRALLLHELAHVARRDNFIATFTSLAGALLWFHPLVWLALRQLDGAREQACDERVAESMKQTGTYLDALTKVCRAILAPRTAGVACMAGANVKERMEHLMRYDTLKQRAWSHRGIVAASLVAILATAVFAANPPAPKNENLYSLRFNVAPQERGVFVELHVVENASGATVTSPRVRTQWGQQAFVTAQHAGRVIEVTLLPLRDRPVELTMVVTEGSEKVQYASYTWTNKPNDDGAKKEGFSGEPISLKLKDAQIRDVMNTFSQMTGLNIVVEENVQGTVTMDVTGMPWDEALLKAAWQVGAKAVVEGKTVRIAK